MNARNLPSSADLRKHMGELRELATDDDETRIVDACDTYLALLDLFESDPNDARLRALQEQFSVLDQLQKEYFGRLGGR